MKNLCLLAVSFALSTSAFAADKGGLFLEPSLTYEKGESETDYPDPAGGASGDINGFGVGARLGFHVYESVFIGADGRYSMPNFEDSGLDQDVKATHYNFGPVLGFQMPTDLGIRVWGTYILGAELDPKKDNDIDVKFEDGSGYRLGGGIKLGWVSLNLEYQLIKYEEAELQEFGIFSSNAEFKNVKLENQSWIVSVSFPISL